MAARATQILEDPISSRRLPRSIKTGMLSLANEMMFAQIVAGEASVDEEATTTIQMVNPTPNISSPMATHPSH
jgi:hypothetical protein